MAKPFKVFLWIVGIALGLLATGVLAFVMLFDPNEFKPKVSQAVKDETGRELTINGDVKLTIFPWLGVSVRDVILGNAPGFGPEPFAQFKEVSVGVHLMPLFRDQVEVGTVNVDGLTLNLAKAADGTTNWADLAKPPAEPPAAPAPEEKESRPLVFTVGGVKIRNATFSYADAQAGTSYKVADLNVETGAVKAGEPLDVTVSFTANSAQPPITAEVRLAATTLANVETQVYEVQKLKLDVTTSGPTVPGGKQSLAATATARYEQEAGKFAMPDLVLNAGDLTLNAAIAGEGLAGEAPKLGGKLSTNTFNPRKVAKSFGVELPPTADPGVLSAASFKADYSGDFKTASLDSVELKLDQTTATGFIRVTDLATQVIAFALKADSFDADRYLPPAAASAGGAAPKDGSGGTGELPIAALDAVNAKGTIDLAALKLKGVKFTNVHLALDAPKGKVKTQELTAQLYGGRIAETTRITPGAKPRFDIKAGLSGINAAPLLQDFSGKNFLSGTGNLELNLSTTGTTTRDLLAALNGAMAASLVNGALEGINLQQTLLQAKALYKREPLPAAEGPARTEFSDLKGSGKFVNGVLKTDTLNAKGKWYTLGGDGDINLVAQQIDYVLKPTITGGDGLKELQGTTVPVRLTGPLTAPKIKVDLESVLKARANQEVQKQIQKQGEKLQKKYGVDLEGLFGKKKSPPPPAPQEQPPQNEQQQSPPQP